MLRRDGPDLACQFTAADGLDLVRVDLGQQPVLSAGKQNAAGFLGGKNAFFAEHIAEFRNALLPYCRKHFLAQKLQIALPVVPVGLRHGVRAHKGRSEIHHMMLLQLSDHAQRFAFFPGRQAVAALGLCGRRAEANHFIQRGGGFCLQLFLACRLCGTHGGQDAAACGEDVQIARAVQLERQLVLPPAAEDQMRVRVDQTGRDQLPSGVDRLRVGSRRRCAGSDLRNHIVFNEYPCVFQNADLALRPASPRRGSLRCGKHTDVGDQRSLHCLFLSDQRSSCATACSTTALPAT